MNSFPKVSIVIPFHNQEKVAEKVVNGVMSLDFPDEKLEIILVDDGSKDNTAGIIANLKSKSIKTVFLKENIGRAKARNAGILNASGEMIGFLDGDMVVDRYWLKEIMTVFKDSAVVACMGESLPPAGQPESVLERYFHSNWRGARKHGGNTPIPFRRFLFNNTIVKKTVLDQIGFFDDSYQGYGGEDTDLAIRFWKSYPEGLRYCPDAHVFHHHHRSVNAFCQDMKHFGRENLPVLINRYPEQKYTLISKWSLFLPGRLLFNPLVRSIVVLLSKVTGATVLTRYLVAESVVSGLRESPNSIKK